MARQQTRSRVFAAAGGLLGCAGLLLSLSGCEAPYDSSTEECFLSDRYAEVKQRNGTSYFQVEYSFNVDGRRVSGSGRLEAEPTTRECRAYYMARNPKNNSLGPSVAWHLGRAINEAIPPWLQVILVLAGLPLGVFAFVYWLPKIWAQSSAFPVEPPGAGGAPAGIAAAGPAPDPAQPKSHKTAFIALAGLLGLALAVDLTLFLAHKVRNPSVQRTMPAAKTTQGEPEDDAAPPGAPLPGPAPKAPDPSSLILGSPEGDGREVQEGRTRDALRKIRADLQEYRLKHLGKPPADLAAFFTKYAVPPAAELPYYHPVSAAIHSLASLADNSAADTGGWAYVSNPRDKDFGAFLINCSHTDSRGSAWDSY
ncbi:MAG: hypothetical protein HZB91_12605 [Elusimicrobia bacterium]|nr:hypothetical protein [Elusimicrobiota bacterium]